MELGVGGRPELEARGGLWKTLEGGLNSLVGPIAEGVCGWAILVDPDEGGTKAKDLDVMLCC